MKKMLSLIAAAVLLFGMLPVQTASAAAVDGAGIVRVGLAYGSSAKLNVNALAESGYSIGYFGADDVFYELINIKNRFVTFAKDVNISISGNTVTESSDGQIGAYHIELGSYATLAELKEGITYFTDMGVFGGISPFPAYVDGVYKIRAGSFKTRSAAQSAADAAAAAAGVAVSAAGGADRCITVIDMNDKFIICEIEPAQDIWPAAFPNPSESGEEQTVKNGTTYYKGAFEFKRLSGGNITFINVVRMDDYLAGVLAGEMSYSWPLEALKAQAVCARGYYVMNKTRHSKNGFGVCATTDCQVYKGTTDARERILQAVAETSGVVATYNGNPISTLFHSSSGGYTESNSNVWGYDPLPYYAPVNDIYTNTSPWTVTLTNEELTQYLQGKNYDIGTVVDFYVSEYTVPAGNVYEVTFVDSTGKKLPIKKSDTVRIALSKYVKSPRFTVTGGSPASFFINGGGQAVKNGESYTVIGAEGKEERTTTAGLMIIDGTGAVGTLPQSKDGTYTITGTGWGHNVGMSQYGAKAMAEQGFTYSDIIKFYFTGTQTSYFEELCTDFVRVAQ